MTTLRLRAPSDGRKHGWVAQLVEQRTENPRVAGSIPAPATFLDNPALRAGRWAMPKVFLLFRASGNDVSASKLVVF